MGAFTVTMFQAAIVDAVIDSVEELIKRGKLSDAQRARVHALSKPYYTDLDAEGLQLIENDLAALIAAGKVPELARARLHAATRKVRMTDEDLHEMVTAEGMVHMTIFNYLQDLRDRYEEIGMYAAVAGRKLSSGGIVDLKSLLNLALQLPEPERALLHAATRKVRMTDEELAEKVSQVMHTDEPAVALRFLLQQIRDRYEEIGKYAPAAAAAPEAARRRLTGVTPEQLAELLIWVYENYDGQILPEQRRARLHALTGKVRMTDEELTEKALQVMHTDEPAVALQFLLQQIRDRYEEIGPYVPAAAPEAATGKVPHG